MSAMTPRGTPSSRQMSKCSRVCGMTDSSAATTSSTASMPPAPASMLRTKRSCPGTSTNATLHVAARPVREPEVDRDAARLFLLEAVGIGPRQRQHEAALAVIDVAGGADDEGVRHAESEHARVIAARRDR